MNLLDCLQRLLGRQPPSADTARERLQLVLAHDRSDLNPDLLEQMRREILEVVQRYVEIDLEGGDVNLSTENQITALVANLPIKRALPRPLPEEDGGGDDPGASSGGDPASAKAAGDPPAPAGEGVNSSSACSTEERIHESAPEREGFERIAPVPAWVAPEGS